MSHAEQGTSARRLGATYAPEEARYVSCDVLVVGAGPAGIMAAREAALAGASVILLETAALPRHKSCGGMLNEYARRTLGRIAALPRDVICDPEWVHFRYYDWDRRIKKLCSLRFCNVDRQRFDAWLLGLLPSSVTVWERARYKGQAEAVAPAPGGGLDVSVLRHSDPYVVRCAWLIGADGAHSSVRRAHPAWPQTACYETLQEFVRITPGTIEPVFDCIYSRHIAPAYGYGYVVPKGDQAIIGSVFYPGTRGVTPMHEAAIRTFRERLPLGDAVRREGGLAIQVRSARDVIAGSGSTLMAGEAAGIMSPSSGEGISFALNSGILAGRAVAAALAEPRGDRSDAVAAYDAALAPIRRNIAFRLKFFPIMNSSWGKWVGGCVPTPIISKITEHL